PAPASVATSSPATASSPAASAPASAPPAPAADGAAGILQEMIAKCQARPSLVQPLRGAQARLNGDTLVLEGTADFAGVASMHAEESRDLARQASKRPLKVQIGQSALPPPEAAAPPSPEEIKRQRLRQEAEREPAVQEALDLFEGKVVDVREAKPV